MLNETQTCENYISAKQSHDAVRVAVVSTALGLWLALSLGRWLSCWAGMSVWRWGAAVVLWPVLWFAIICIYTQSLMFLAALLAKIGRLSERTYGQLTSFLVLTGFSGLAAWDMLQDDSIDKAIGGLWFAGLMVCGLAFRKRKPAFP